LNGAYRTTLKKQGTLVKVVEEPCLQYVPVLYDDDGSPFEIEVSYQPPGFRDYIRIYQETAQAQPPPLKVGGMDDCTASDSVVFFKSALGIPGAYSIIEKRNFQIESDGYFEKEAHHVWYWTTADRDADPFFGTRRKYGFADTTGLVRGEEPFDFALVPTAKFRAVQGRPRTVNITITDPLTKQSYSGTITISPAKN
jgi:hypothetical protein